jgi:hypothetical protein
VDHGAAQILQTLEQHVHKPVPNAQAVHPVNDPLSSKASIATYALLNIINSDGSSCTSDRKSALTGQFGLPYLAKKNQPCFISRNLQAPRAKY